jgi:hypothetical protein
MKNYIIKPILSKPGIQRDGTPFASDCYIDGQWCRFYMGKPRKIDGYELIDNGNLEIMRSLFSVPLLNQICLYIGRASSLAYNVIDFNGDDTGEIDVTPAGYVSNPNNIWDFDLFTTTTNGAASSFVVASVIPNGNDWSNITNGSVYFAIPNTNAPLQLIDPGINYSGTIAAPNSPVDVSGGIVFASPFMLAYGNNGFIRWSEGGRISGNIAGLDHDPGAWPDDNTAVIANTKVIQIYPARGSGAPQLLAWTLDSLININYTSVTVGQETTGTFTGSLVQDGITVMSPKSIVQYNQLFFWVGIDQFYVYNGLAQRLDNSMSTDWFFNKINLGQRSKVWGMSIPRYKEIWWFYPRGDNQQECNAVVIYNVELNVWYDSMISRAAGVSPGVFPFPLMSDSEILAIHEGRGIAQGYGLWMHEFGYDQVVGNTKYAINSYFETSITTLFEGQPENNRLIRSRRIEPDFAQPDKTTMTVTVNNRMFPSDTLENGNLIQSGPYTFTPDTQKIDDVNSQGRLVSYVFASNEAGGSYQAGKSLLNFEIGDVRP